MTQFEVWGRLNMCDFKHILSFHRFGNSSVMKPTHISHYFIGQLQFQEDGEFMRRQDIHNHVYTKDTNKETTKI